GPGRIEMLLMTPSGGGLHCLASKVRPARQAAVTPFRAARGNRHKSLSILNLRRSRRRRERPRVLPRGRATFASFSGRQAQRAALVRDELDVVRDVVGRPLEQVLEGARAALVVDADAPQRLGLERAQDAGHLAARALDEDQLLFEVALVV